MTKRTTLKTLFNFWNPLNATIVVSGVKHSRAILKEVGLDKAVVEIKERKRLPILTRNSYKLELVPLDSLVYCEVYPIEIAGQSWESKEKQKIRVKL